MSSVDNNKATIAVLEEEYIRLPVLVGQIMQLLQLQDSETQNAVVNQRHYAFRMLLSQYILESLIQRTSLSCVEDAAAALDETILVELKESTDRIVGKMLAMAVEKKPGD